MWTKGEIKQHYSIKKITIYMQCEEDEDCQNDSCRNIATLESDKQTMKTIAVFIKITHIGN